MRGFLSVSAGLQLVLLCALARAADPVRLEGPGLSVLLDPEFPRAIEYRTEAGATLTGQREAGGAVALNGTVEPCTITFRKTGANEATYRLAFTAKDCEVELRVAVRPAHVEWRVDGVRERGATKILTLAFPGQTLLTIRSDEPDAAIAALHATCRDDKCQGEFREKIGALAGLEPSSDDGNYFFASTGSLAAGIAANGEVDTLRTAWRITVSNGVKTCVAGCPNWLYREQPDEPVNPRVVCVFVTADRNGDGRATWQDAALVYRNVMPKPFGQQFTHTTVGENIAMNFASGAQQPFLRILDNVKKAWLATDGLGQQVVIKGFSSEGHDSANTDYGGHYNERAGGLKDLTVLLERARDYNARIGIHINASEVYPEANRYKPEILQRDAKGNPKGGWAWLDHAHMIDKRKDIRSGQLFAALDQMRRELPKLDFVYVDTYWENGWPAWKTATKINALGLPMYTEGDMPLDPWTTWSHWRGKGSAIERFIWFSDRDIFGNDVLLRGGRGDNDGFMGWQNQHSFPNFIRSTFSRHLPATWLRRFNLLRWEPGREAVFSDGIRVASDGGVVTCTESGRVVMTWTGDGADTRLLLPWGDRLYAWDPVGPSMSWELPAFWRDLREVFVYPLSDEGRGEVRRVPVEAGRITLHLEKGVPYVVYSRPAPAQKPLAWGEGGPVRDPGFDSHRLGAWQADVPQAVTFQNDARGNTRLVVGPEAVHIRQKLEGLEPGRLHAATVWAMADGRRTLSLEVRPEGGATVSNYVTRFDVRHAAPNDPRTGSLYQRLRVVFELPKGSRSAELMLCAGAGAGTAEFDDVRVVPTGRSEAGAAHAFFEDFEHVETGGYGPFTCCPGERTHLSEANPPYTHDTIAGRFSLKSRDNGRVVRTLPCTLRLKPLTRYRVTCDTMGIGHLTAESKGRTLLSLPFPNKGDGVVGAISGEFGTGTDGESFLALYRDGGDAIVVDNLALDELGPAAAPTAVAVSDLLPPGKVLLEDRFTGTVARGWTVIASKRPGTQVVCDDGALRIAAPANVSALVEAALPAGAAAVVCRIANEGDQGQTWGPGVSVLWPGGQQLRVNLRGPDGCFGVDSTAAAQARVGQLTATESTLLRIRWDDAKVMADVRQDAGDWHPLAEFPRAKFPGEPAKVRLGKMHAVEGTDDHSDPGAAGACSYDLLRVYGR